MKNIILIHGALGHNSHFDILSKSLSTDYKVHSLLFKDHGIDNASKEKLNISRLIQELDEFIDSNNIEKPNVFGYSMGGYVALCHTLQFKNKIEKIATLATKFEWSPEIASKETSFLNADIIEEKIPKYAEQLEKMHGEKNWKTLLSKTADLMTDIGGQNYLATSKLSDIVIPVQLMLGDSDRMVSLKETTAIYGELLNATLAILPNTKHPLENVNTELLRLLLKQFFG